MEKLQIGTIFSQVFISAIWIVMIIMSKDDNQRRKTLVGLAVEKTLLDMGKPELEEVSMRLRKYHCKIYDCYEHPEYLNQILKDLYGNSYKTIIEGIQKNLGEFNEEKSIVDFLRVINE